MAKAKVIRLDPLGPEAIRQQAKAGGPTAVMQSAWRDPDDVQPNSVRKAREISGYRTYCPLRRMASKHGTRITPEHILAADYLRRAVDLAVIGAGGSREMIARNCGFGPSGPPSEILLKQSTALREVVRALAHFAPAQRIMLTEIVLLNRSLFAWCARQAAIGRVNADVEMGKLIAMLEVLVEHFGAEIDEDIAAGRMDGAA